MTGCCPEFVRVLKRLRRNNEPVTIIVKSGSDCCSHTGCICEIVDDCYVTLLSGENGCDRTYIPLDCICAVIDPAEANDVNDVNVD